LEIGKTIYVTDRHVWRAWLEANFQTAKEIWLISSEQNSSNQRIEYNEAVEEALCFGWIDSTVKRFDDHSTAQRFSPRKPGSAYSQANIERLRWLLAEGRLHPCVQESVRDILRIEFVFPPDIIKAIQENEKAWKNYLNFSPSYQRIRVAYIDGARNRPDEFKKRLINFIKKTEQNKMIGYGGIEKYY